jgi:hypothetical protein
MRWARVAKPDAKPDDLQALEPVSQPAISASAMESASFAALWQAYESALVAKWGGFAVPAVPVRAELGSSLADAAAAEAGGRE